MEICEFPSIALECYRNVADCPYHERSLLFETLMNYVKVLRAIDNLIVCMRRKLIIFVVCS